MDVAYLSALSALGGSVVGGLTVELGAFWKPETKGLNDSDLSELRA
jgi:hypothetical protein